MEANIIKRHFYNGLDYFLDKENKVIKLAPHFHQQLKAKKLWGKFGFKKVGGSFVGDVLVVNQFSSQFSAFCNIVWLGLPILDRKYVEAGIHIESKVVSVVKEFLEKKYQKSIEIKTYNPKEIEYDLFKGKDDVLGGIPDGYIPEFSTILEVKTAGEKKYDFWNRQGVPLNYLRQAQLYTYLMNCSNFWIAATFLKDEDYANPEAYDIHNRKIKTWQFKLNKAQVLDDAKKIKDWYYQVTASGISPQYNETKDKDLIEWLECRNVQEWEVLKERWIQEGKLII